MLLKVDNEIRLKQLEKIDAKDIFQTIDEQREYLGKWLPFVKNTKTIADTEKFIDSVINAPKEKFEYIFTIQKENKFVGLIGFNNTNKLNKKTEIGYWISKDFQKQGIVTKSLEKLCEFAFEELKLNRLQINCVVGNLPSKNIPKKLNFKFEGIERQGELIAENTFTDLEIYSKLKNDLYK
ncbi:MAG: GNAT family N-acetyltransferase [Fusobacteriales bacterium]|nr:MAG: GNAT family N-acetyltransferase [Fusobacteriales bacterium]